MVIQMQRVQAELMLVSQLKASDAPPSPSDMNASSWNMPMRRVAVQGIPKRDTRAKIFGARPSSASAYSDREPVSMPWLPEDHAEVTTTALMIEGSTLTPALVAARVKGDEAAVPSCFVRWGSFDGTMRPTMNRDTM